MKSFIINISIALALGLGLALTLLWVLGGATLPTAHATTPQSQNQPSLLQSGDVITVCLIAVGTCDYDNIQAAVDAANDGAVIKVAAGTYTGVEAHPSPLGYDGPSVVTQVVYISKEVTVQGGYTTTDSFADPPDPETNPTTLDAQKQGRVLFIAGDITATIEGLRIVGGDASGLGGDPWGYGWLDSGGGAYVVSATVVIANSEISGNAAGYGGGLLLNDSSFTLNGSIVYSNTADNSGGIWSFNSNARLTNNVVSFNTAVYYGGGILAEFGKLTLEANKIISNVAETGGGLAFIDSSGVMTNSVIADNLATHQGGALVVDSDYESSSVYLVHCTIARNRCGFYGSGIHVDGSGGDTQNTVAMTNTILVSHTIGILAESGTTATLEATLWGTATWANESDWGGSGTIVTSSINIWDDPAFVNPDAGDYHISSSSAARDAGVNAGVNEDIDGDTRPVGIGYDLGADEYAPATLTPVSDLRVAHTLTDTTMLTATLSWSAPPSAVTCTLRYSGSLINAGNWIAATVLTDALPGNTSVHTVAVPYSGGSVYFALKYLSTHGGESSVSNNAFWPRWDIYLPLVLRQQ